MTENEKLKIIGDEWHQLSNVDREAWNEKGKKEKMKYLVEMENYKKKKTGEEKKTKKKGEKKANKKEEGEATISSHSDAEEKPLAPLILSKENEKPVTKK